LPFTHAQHSQVVTTTPFQQLEVWRRFSDFEKLQRTLEILIPGAILPVLPEKIAQLKEASMADLSTCKPLIVRAKVKAKAHTSQQSSWRNQFNVEQISLRERADALFKVWGVILIQQHHRAPNSHAPQALAAYLDVLVGNGEAIREVSSVRSLVEIFLSGTVIQWNDSRESILASAKTTKGAAAEADAAEEPAEDGKEKEKKAEEEAAAAAAAAAASPAKKSGWGFSSMLAAMPKVSLPVMSTKSAELKKLEEKTEDDLMFDTFAAEVEKQLSCCATLDGKARSLVALGSSQAVQPIAEDAAKIATRAGGAKVSAVGAVLTAKQEKAERVADAKAEIEAWKNEDGSGNATQPPQTELDSRWLLEPLAAYLSAYAAAAIPESGAHTDRLMVCLDPLHGHILALQAVKHAVEKRQAVRANMLKLARAHDAKKSSLQKAYDNPKTDAKAKEELEAQVESSNEAMVEAQAALKAATARFNRDLARHKLVKVGRPLLSHMVLAQYSLSPAAPVTHTCSPVTGVFAFDCRCCCRW